jgi:hypothetical protein
MEGRHEALIGSRRCICSREGSVAFTFRRASVLGIEMLFNVG